MWMGEQESGVLPVKILQIVVCWKPTGGMEEVWWSGQASQQTKGQRFPFSMGHWPLQHTWMMFWLPLMCSSWLTIGSILFNMIMQGPHGKGIFIFPHKSTIFLSSIATLFSRPSPYWPSPQPAQTESQFKMTNYNLGRFEVWIHSRMEQYGSV